MTRQDETLFYLYGNAAKPIGGLVGVNVLALGFVLFVCERDFMMWTVATTGLL